MSPFWPLRTTATRCNELQPMKRNGVGNSLRAMVGLMAILSIACSVAVGCGSGQDHVVIDPGEPYQMTETERQALAEMEAAH